jgi:hypothetical protein
MAYARKHPVWITALSTAAVLLVVFLFPISFDRTVGHDVSMKLEGAALDPARIAALGREIQTQLGVDELALTAHASSGAASYTLTTRVPANQGAQARRVADAFAKALAPQGLEVTFSVTPRVERVSGSMAAYAADRVIRIETEGKSAEQIGAEIRTALEQAGFGPVEVSVSDEAGQRRVEVRAEREGPAGDPPQEMPQIVVGDEGADPERTAVQMRRIKDDSGATSIRVNVTVGGRDTEVTIPNVDSMSDLALESEIERQLSTAGLSNVDVTVRDGKIDVETR